jgi:hypothetical protein
MWLEAASGEGLDDFWTWHGWTALGALFDTHKELDDFLKSAHPESGTR